MMSQCRAYAAAYAVAQKDKLAFILIRLIMTWRGKVTGSSIGERSARESYPLVMAMVMVACKVSQRKESRF